MEDPVPQANEEAGNSCCEKDRVGGCPSLGEAVGLSESFLNCSCTGQSRHETRLPQNYSWKLRGTKETEPHPLLTSRGYRDLPRRLDSS